jgi:hypothetical protein
MVILPSAGGCTVGVVVGPVCDDVPLAVLPDPPPPPHPESATSMPAGTMKSLAFMEELSSGLFSFGTSFCGTLISYLH